MNLIRAMVKKDDELILVSKSILLEPCSHDTTRQFSFRENQWKKKEIGQLDGGELRVAVFYFTKNHEWAYHTEFRLRITECQNLSDQELKVSGFIRQDDVDRPYSQGITDIFKMWQTNLEIEWFSLPENYYLKHEYFLACMIYSGISETILRKQVYELDLSLVREFQDFIYLAGVAFVGNRYYMGYTPYTFADCLLTIFHKRGEFFSDVEVRFLHANVLSDRDANLYREIKDIFIRFKFNITEA